MCCCTEYESVETDYYSLLKLLLQFREARKFSVRLELGVSVTQRQTSPWNLTLGAWHLPLRALLDREELRQGCGRVSERARQTQLGQIVREHAVDIIEVRAGHRFLRLHDLHVLAHA